MWCKIIKKRSLINNEKNEGMKIEKKKKRNENDSTSSDFGSSLNNLSME